MPRSPRKPFGPQLPIARRYVFEFGTCVISFIYLEHYLQQYLFHRRVLAAQWPLKPKKFEKVFRSLLEVRLPQLTDGFEKHERAPRLIARLRNLVPKRNALMHNVLPTFDRDSLALMLPLVKAHRKRFRTITASVHKAMLAVEKADAAVFAQIEARNKREPMGTREDVPAIADLFDKRTAWLLSTLDS